MTQESTNSNLPPNSLPQFGASIGDRVIESMVTCNDIRVANKKFHTAVWIERMLSLHKSNDETNPENYRRHTVTTISKA